MRRRSVPGKLGQEMEIEARRPEATRGRPPHHRHHHVLVVAALVAMFAVAPLGLLVRLTSGVEPGPSPEPATTTATAPAHRAVTVLLVGDSLIHEAAAGITAELPGTTVIDGSALGSGLLGGPVDWFARAAELVARYRPEVVVVSFVGNYDPSSGTFAADTPAYYAAWAAASRRLTDQLRASGARVDWVAQPPLHPANFYGIAATRTQVLTAQARALANRPGVGLVGADDAVSTADGSYTVTHDVCGVSATIRLADGVHFTTIGGDWWGAQLGRAIAGLEQLPARDACAVLVELDPALG